MLPLLRGEKEVIYTSDYSMGWELFGRREIRQGGWKMVWLNTPWGKGGWELFNLVVDPAEEFDLSEKLPGKQQGMLLLW